MSSYLVDSSGVRYGLNDPISFDPMDQYSLYIAEVDVSRCADIVARLSETKGIRWLDVYVTSGQYSYVNCIEQLETLFYDEMSDMSHMSITYRIQRTTRTGMSLETRSGLFERNISPVEIYPDFGSDKSSISLVAPTMPTIIAASSSAASSSAAYDKKAHKVRRRKHKGNKFVQQIVATGYGSGTLGELASAKRGGCIRILTNEELITIFSAEMPPSERYKGYMQRADPVNIQGLLARHKLTVDSAKVILKLVLENKGVYARLSTPELRRFSSYADLKSNPQTWRSCLYILYDMYKDKDGNQSADPLPLVNQKRLRTDIVIFFD